MLVAWSTPSLSSEYWNSTETFGCVPSTTTYGKQAQIYAWAAHRATGMPVREVVFLFARIPKESATLVDAAFMAAADALMRDAAVGVTG